MAGGPISATARARVAGLSMRRNGATATPSSARKVFSRSRSWATCSACGARTYGYACGQALDRLGRHVLELEGDDVDRAGEGVERRARRHRRRPWSRPTPGSPARPPRGRRCARGSRNRPRPAPSCGRAGRRPGCRWSSPAAAARRGFGHRGRLRPGDRRPPPSAAARQSSSALRSFASPSARMAAASSAAFMAPAVPIASVPTGTPPGICTIDRRLSSPPSALLSIGTPKHRQRRHRRHHARQMRGAAGAGDDDLDTALAGRPRVVVEPRRACGAPRRCATRRRRRAPSSISAAWRMVSQSDWLPMMMPTMGLSLVMGPWS